MYEVCAARMPSWPSVAFSVKTSATLLSPHLSSSVQAILWLGLVQPRMPEPPETLHVHPLTSDDIHASEPGIYLLPWNRCPESRYLEARGTKKLILRADS